MKKLILILLLVCLTASISNAATVVGQYVLDEGSGTEVEDSSPTNATGSITSPANWDVNSVAGNALEFNPDSGDTAGCVTVSENLNLSSSLSLTCWVKNYGQTTYGRLWHTSGSECIELAPDNKIWLYWSSDYNGDLTVAEDGQWHFVAVTADSTDTWIYIDGDSEKVSTSGTPTSSLTWYTFGGYDDGGSFQRPLHGVLDDWRLFSGVLTADEVAQIRAQNGDPNNSPASSPYPADEASGVSTDANLIWLPSLAAGSHDIYIGTTFADVNTATTGSDEYQCTQDANEYDPDLSAGTTYYWRIDEVNDAKSDPNFWTGEVWSFTTQAGEAEPNYYVATDGNDNNPGTLAEPFLTIGKARDVIRNCSSLPAGGVTVWIRGGDYYLDSTLSFTEEDSGEATKVITYRNYASEEPNIIGGQEITGWVLDSGSIYKADVSSWTFDTLFENRDDRCTKAREPNTGYLTMESKVDTLVFSYWDGDLSAFDANDTEAFIWPGEGYWNWASETLAVTDVDFTNRQITIVSEPMLSWSFERGNRYYLQGSKDFLTKPGEFSLDESTGYVYYWPVNTPIASQEIVAPKVKRIIEVKGSSEPGSVAEYITFQGLNFTITDYSDDSWEGSDGLIHIECANNITVQFCRIENAGCDGVLIRKYGQYNEIYGNLISDIGTNGVSLHGWAAGSGPYSSASESYTNKNHTISNNYIKNCGVLVGHGNGIYAKQSGDNEISYNRIRDIVHHGITIVGPGWAYLPNPCYGEPVTWANHWDFVHARNCDVNFNDVGWCCTDTQDVGIFYAFCSGKDNLVYNNLFHDSRATVGTRFAEGIYLDDEAGHFTVQNNIVYNLGFRRNPGSGILTKGEYNTITNNIVVDNNNTDVDINIRFAEPGTVLTNNILYRDNGKYLYSFWEWEDGNEPVESENNVFYHPGDNGRNIMYGIPGDDTLTNWKTLFSNKYDQNSVTSDPCFASLANHNYWLQDDSPALTLGFVNIDQNDIGLKGDFPFSVDSDPAEATDDPETTPMAHFELNEGSGSRVSDESYDLDGYIDTPANWSSDGVLGTSAIEFNPDSGNTDGQLHVATGFRFDGLTLTCWVKNYGQTVWGRLLQGAGGECIALDTSDQIGCSYYTDYTSSITVPQDGFLHFVAVAANDTTTTFYVDDSTESVSTQGDPSFAAWDGLYFGGYVGDGWTRPFHGVIDDWRIFATELTSSQIETIRDEKVSMLFNDGFDVSEWNGVWTEDVQNDWFRTTSVKHDGAASACVDGGASDATLTTASNIDVSDSNTVTVDCWWWIDNTLDPGEYIKCEYQLDGGSWTELDSLDGDVDTENTWHHLQEDVDVSGISNMLLRFKGNMDNAQEDAYVDTVKVDHKD